MQKLRVVKKKMVDPSSTLWDDANPNRNKLLACSHVTDKKASYIISLCKDTTGKAVKFKSKIGYWLR